VPPLRPSRALRGWLLVAAFACWWLIPHRGVAFWPALLVHLAATGCYLWACTGLFRGARVLDLRLRDALLVAVALRALAVPMGPELSDDVYRYLWEGRLVQQGVNPFVVAPDDPSLIERRDDDGAGGAYWQRINNKEIPAVYPPAVQGALAVAVTITPHPWGMGLVFGAFDLLAFVLLWRWLPRIGVSSTHAILYGWCPLLVLEYAGEAHSDALANAFLAATLYAVACRRAVAAGACLALATAGKLYPIALLPFVLRDLWAGRGGRPAPLAAALAFAVTIALVYAPFVPLDDPAAMLRGTVEYAARWRSNEFGYTAIHEGVAWLHRNGWIQWIDPAGWLGGELQRFAKIPLALGLVVLLVWALLRRWRLHEVGFGLMLYLVTFSPTLHPWYVGLLVLWLPARPSPWLAAFTGSVFIAYHVLPGWLAEGEWRESDVLRVAGYAPLVAYWISAVALRVTSAHTPKATARAGGDEAP
jgi:hypothetical protein